MRERGQRVNGYEGKRGDWKWGKRGRGGEWGKQGEGRRMG